MGLELLVSLGEVRKGPLEVVGAALFVVEPVAPTPEFKPGSGQLEAQAVVDAAEPDEGVFEVRMALCEDSLVVGHCDRVVVVQLTTPW